MIEPYDGGLSARYCNICCNKAIPKATTHIAIIVNSRIVVLKDYSMLYQATAHAHGITISYPLSK